MKITPSESIAAAKELEKQGYNVELDENNQIGALEVYIDV